MTCSVTKLVLSIMLLLAAGHVNGRMVQLNNDTHKQLWSHWKQLHNKQYATAHQEERKRSQWTANLIQIMQHNIRHDFGLVTYSMGLNQYSDLSWNEFRQRYLTGLTDPSVDHSRLNAGPDRTAQRGILFDLSTVAEPEESIDWRQKGLVRQVKQQGACGSCWAFSTTGAIEGQYAKKYGKPLEFSEQQLVDCSSSFGNQGCNGGLMELAYEYLENFGLEPENLYPYHARDETCRFAPSAAVAMVDSFIKVYPGDEQALKGLVSSFGPVAVGVDADSGFQHYRSGIYQSATCLPTALNHGVLVVGYGTEGIQPYWTVKNSWGAGWGEAGYIRLARDRGNMCGVATDATLPKLR